MNWSYEDKVKEYIAQAVRDTGVGDEYNFEVCTEQMFVKKTTLDPNTVYVIIKYLSSTNTLNAVTQPIQLLISCEQNQIQISQIVFGKLVEQHNFESIVSDGTYVKQDYREPVVLSNFNEVSYGYRTIMYISATLFIMENVIDVKDFKIKIGDNDAENVKPISFNIAYSMTPNTQPIPPAKIATSVKSLATFSITFAVPMIEYNFLETITKIMSGDTSGNTDFKVSFLLGTKENSTVTFGTEFVNVPMKLVSAQITTAINEVPGIQIALMR